MNRLLRDHAIVKRVNALDDEGMAALHYAARANHFEAVALLVEKANAGVLLEKIYKSLRNGNLFI